jgi:hypothetical protein
MSETRQSFGVQAARFSLFAPLAVILIGVTTRLSAAQIPSVAIAIAWINGGLIVLGFLLAIAALISMVRFGPEGILMQATIGLVLNGALLLVLLSVIMSARALVRNRQLLMAHWQLQSGPDKSFKSLELTLDPNNTFVIEGDKNDGTHIKTDGTWTVSGGGLIGVTVDHANGENSQLKGKHMDLGTVRTLNEQQLILGTDKGDETYRRAR